MGEGFRIDLLLSAHLLIISNGKREKIKMQTDPYQEEDEAFIEAMKKKQLRPEPRFFS